MSQPSMIGLHWSPLVASLGIVLGCVSPLAAEEEGEDVFFRATISPVTDEYHGQWNVALAELPEAPGTVHRTEITEDAKPHYHRRMTETYYVLECGQDAKMELDGELVPIRPGTCVFIPPGVVHRAVGRMTILNIVFPKFDPADEILVDE